jgi:DNA repair protein RadD
MYQTIIKEMRVTNPNLKVIGLSATPYRLGQGMITDGGLFTDICFDLTGVDAFNRLIAEGYICPLIPKRTLTELDVSNVSLVNGDFAKGELQRAVDKKEVTYAALKELCGQGFNRRSWLIFASGIEHAEHIAEILSSFGVTCKAVHSKIPSDERDNRILAFRRGECRAISNNNVLTTGFDYAPIDLIGMLRPTVSPGLWVQMLGRGTRPSPETGKLNCLVMDFAGNRKRLGPINDPCIPKKKGNKTGDVPVKICDECGTYNHPSVRFCINPECGFEFIFQTKIVRTASSEQLLRSNMPIVEMFDVDRVFYKRHSKIGMPPSIRVSYYSGLQKFDEWVCLEHGKHVGKRARDWWRQRSIQEPPATTEEALGLTSTLRVPKRVRVWVNKKWQEVLSYEF